MKMPLACLALCAPIAISAQPQPQPQPPPLPNTLAFAAGELRAERIVEGAPYCADAVHEAVQTLTDGNRIVRRSTTRLCRDGEGRTRQETERAGRVQVWLRDPVAGEAWLLDPARKTARQFSLDPGAGPLIDASAWREYGERMREWAQHFAHRLRGEPVAKSPEPPEPPTPVLITPGEVLPAGDPLTLPMPPGVAWRSHSAAPRGPGVVSALPARQIEGLTVHGERTTWTIEAGRIGNEKPIVITREVWSSPELMLTVLSRDADPRSGETIYRLANVHRGEPDPASMKVPPDYETIRVRTPRTPSPPARQ